MPSMDKKQKKEKKREEKRKRARLSGKQGDVVTKEQKSFGKFQLIIMGIVVLLISFFIFFRMDS